jgi:ubiquinone/menaquinone biosynthesis C-methylase UbiE
VNKTIENQNNSNEEKHLELNQKKWDSWAPKFDTKRYSAFRYWQKKTISLTHLQPDQNFLDVGCGTGWAVLFAAHFLNAGGTAVGVDLSEKMIEKAQMNGEDVPNAKFYIANAEKMPLEDNFFDCIICTNSFHHYLHPNLVLAEMVRILKNKGRIYILDVGKDTFIFSFVNWIAKKTEPEHVNLYNTKEFKKLFSEANLSYVSTKLVLPLLMVRIAEKKAD